MLQQRRPVRSGRESGRSPRSPARIAVVTSPDGAALRDIIDRDSAALAVQPPRRASARGCRARARERSWSARSAGESPERGGRRASWAAAAARGRTSRHSTARRSAARSPRSACRPSRRSGTRPTSRSRISSPTCAPPRRPPRPKLARARPARRPARAGRARRPARERAVAAHPAGLRAASSATARPAFRRDGRGASSGPGTASIVRRPQLDALSPLRVLGRGYADAHRADGRVLKRRAEFLPGDALRPARVRRPRRRRAWSDADEAAPKDDEPPRWPRSRAAGGDRPPARGRRRRARRCAGPVRGGCRAGCARRASVSPRRSSRCRRCSRRPAAISWLE